MSFRTPCLLLALACSLPGHSQSLSDAFSQGAQTGRAANAAARTQISTSNAQANVPGYTNTAPETTHFGGPGISAPAVSAANACAAPAEGAEAGTQACAAVEFSQTNPGRRASFSIGADDPLRAGARLITADPQAIAGNIAGTIAGTYSGCTVQTITAADRFETALCHQVRATETLTCDKILFVTPTRTPGCTAGQFLTRVTADPCPRCADYLAIDFTCATNSYLMRVYSINRSTGQVFMEMGSTYVPGALNTQIPQQYGPARFSSQLCYQTQYSQSCSGPNCTIGVWFSNPCQGTSYYGTSTFQMPTIVGFADSWVNQCAALEARAR